MSKPSTTQFQQSYYSDFPWVKEDPRSSTSAICTWCNTVINITGMGKTALRSHAKSKKHISNARNKEKTLPIGMFLKNKTPLIPTSTSSTCATSSSSNTPIIASTSTLPSNETSLVDQVPRTQPPVLKKFLLSEKVTKSEIFWCLQTVINHLSFRTAAKLAAGFGKQFSDSEIAGKIQLKRTKVAYTLVFGLAPYFHKQLSEKISKSTYLVLCFDESLNNVSQKEQMDLHIRFLNGMKVETHYYTSVFLGHTTASDMLDAITGAISNEDLKKVVQLSMDGPNVNLKLFSDLQSHLKESPETPQLLNIGTCGLHTIHNAFKVAINSTGWDVIKFLRSLHNVFHKAPARRADYIRCSGSSVFPLEFCAVRWVESAPVAERALKILPNVIKYITNVAKEPNSSSFRIVKDAIKDNLLGAKLAFFASLASMAEPFLREFQDDKPMAPFLFTEIQTLTTSLMERVVKPEVLEKFNGQLEKLVLKSDNLIAAKNIDLGFTTKDALRNSKKSPDLDVLQFRNSCRTAFITMIDKIMDKSPLKYSLTKWISCLDPGVISSDYKIAENRLTKCLEVLVALKWKTGIGADIIKREYKEVFGAPCFIEQCKEFRRAQTRLDCFLFEAISLSRSQASYNQLKDFVCLILTLSHGDSSVERGFSVNAECVVENLREESLVALRQVYDGVLAAGGIDDMEINKEMVHSARNAHAKYTEFLKQKQQEQTDEEKAGKLKRKAAMERKELEAKKLKIMEEARKQAALLDEQISNISKNT